MPEFNTVENPLFIPMLGRIYGQRAFSEIFCMMKTRLPKEKLPKSLMKKDPQSQGTLLASMSRSSSMGRYIRELFRRRPDGVIAGLGCGLENTFYQNGRYTRLVGCRSAGSHEISKYTAPGTGTTGLF